MRKRGLWITRKHSSGLSHVVGYFRLCTGHYDYADYNTQTTTTQTTLRRLQLHRLQLRRPQLEHHKH